MKKSDISLKTQTFPWKLHEMLGQADRDGFDGIVSWLPDGKSFKVYNSTAFVQRIMPNFFKQSKYKSFQRQLNLWGFERIGAGPGKGGYLHKEFFVRENRDEILSMKRHKIKRNSLPIVNKGKPTMKIQELSHRKATAPSGVVTIVSKGSSIDSNGDLSSTSSGSDWELSPSSSLRQIYNIPPQDSNIPQSGDSMDFEGRNFIFIDEKEIGGTAEPLQRPFVDKPLPLLPVWPPQTNLNNAHMLSELSRRRVSVELNDMKYTQEEFENTTESDWLIDETIANIDWGND